MLSERQLQAALKLFDERMQALNEEYLRMMGEHIRDLGKLTASDMHRTVQMKRMNANVEAIKRKIARAMDANIKDVEQVFLAAAESDAKFAAAIFGETHSPTVKGNKPLERILKAQLRLTEQSMQNLSRTTILSEPYRKAVDVGVTAVQTGLTDYNSAVRRAMREAAGEGLRVKYPNSGLTRRLDTAVRQNILDGVRSINQDVLNQLGKEFGADGVEISAHALCAEDHLPYQGRQFSNKEFADLQNSLDRQIGAWNCKHTVHPILLGISQPTYSDAELDAFRQNSREEIEIDGTTLTRYEWTQEQRRLETQVRYQKDIAVAAKASGDDVLRREAQAKINDLTRQYSQISEKADLIEQRERMAVSGFRKVKTFGELKSTSNRLQESGLRGIMDARGMAMGLRKPASHILTSEEIESVLSDAKALGIDEKLLRFNTGTQTSYSERRGIVDVCGDILPDTTSTIARDRMSSRAVLAHEYYGHCKNSPSRFPIGDWRDEFRASYNAAINAPNLTDAERRDLMVDAFDRAREAGRKVSYNRTARRLIYGYDV